MPLESNFTLRYLISLLLLFWMCSALPAQVARNPFELEARLPAEKIVAGEVVAPTGNPFDLRPGNASATSSAPASAPKTGREAKTGIQLPVKQNGPLVIQSADPEKGKGTILAIHVLLLLALSGLWLVFGKFIRQCLEGVVNDSLMTQLYTRRSGGELGAMWAGYLFAILAIGFYLHMMAEAKGLSFGISIWASWLTYALVVAAALGVKNLIIGLFARLFPVRKEAGRYLFTLMVFTILAGLVIAPVNLLISYAPEEWRGTFVSVGMVVLVLAYVLHLFRGVLISNRYLVTRPVHILLYICAIETAPLFVVYRLLSDSIA